VYGLSISVLDSVAELSCKRFCSVLTNVYDDCILLSVSVDSVNFNRGYEKLDSITLSYMKEILGESFSRDSSSFVKKFGFGENCFHRSDSTLLSTRMMLIPREMYSRCSIGGKYKVYSSNSCSKELLTIQNISNSDFEDDVSLGAVTVGVTCRTNFFRNLLFRIGLIRRVKNMGECSCEEDFSQYLKAIGMPTAD